MNITAHKIKVIDIASNQVVPKIMHSPSPSPLNMGSQ